jgi:hypothetical protein
VRDSVPGLRKQSVLFFWNFFTGHRQSQTEASTVRNNHRLRGFSLLLALPLVAQQTPPLAPDGRDTKNREQKSPVNDRLFWALPNYLTVESGKGIRPLTTGQKFKLVARQSFDPVQYPYVGFLALLDQVAHSEPTYGQGATGYAKRFGTSFADITIANFMTGAVCPSLFRQDPRYFQMGQGRLFRRAGYAVSRIFITRADSGRRQFNYSEIAGNAVSAAIATAYHPAHDRTAENITSVWWTQTAWDAMANEAVEFWPDIRRKFRRK